MDAFLELAGSGKFAEASQEAIYVETMLAEQMLLNDSAESSFEEWLIFFIVLMAIEIAQGNYVEVRFISRRIPAQLKEFPAIEQLRQVSQLLAASDFSTALQLLIEYAWPQRLQSTLAHTVATVRRGVADNISCIYSALPLSELARHLALALDDTRSECTRRGWTVDAADFVEFPARSARSAISDTGEGIFAAHIHTALMVYVLGAPLLLELSRYVAVLERKGLTVDLADKASKAQSDSSAATLAI